MLSVVLYSEPGDTGSDLCAFAHRYHLLLEGHPPPLSLKHFVDRNQVRSTMTDWRCGRSFALIAPSQNAAFIYKELRNAKALVFLEYACCWSVGNFLCD